MTHDSMAERYLAETHRVENIPPLLEHYNLYTQDPALMEAVTREGGAWANETLTQFGALTGSRERIYWGEQATRYPPRFTSHNRYGERVDEIEFHPAYHQLMKTAKENGLHALPWTQPGPGAHVVRAALYYQQAQIEAGHGCPITMTFACVPTLKKQADIAQAWLPKILSPEYDPSNQPDKQKQGLTLGMAMTEKQGGSDVRTNSTQAYAIGTGGPGQAYELVGHKYFVSAPMSDGFLTLAKTDQGISCFLVPRWRPDGSKNAMHINQLKDKMGNVSNASCETELRGALAWMIGEEGRGIANILEMVALTRFDCMIGSSAGMRQAVSQAVHHAAHRVAFGNKLTQQPLMQNVLADLALEAEAATALTFRLARALDQAPTNEAEALLNRLATPIGKFWICKRTPEHAYEAMECIGGSGAMETTRMPRLYREAPINAIWEGSGNVQCLDVLRAIEKSPDALDAFFSEVKLTQGQHPALDATIRTVEKRLLKPKELEYHARELVKKMALALQGSLLIRAGQAAVSDAFCAARLAPDNTHIYGVLPKGIDCQALIARARPQIDL